MEVLFQIWQKSMFPNGDYIPGIFEEMLEKTKGLTDFSIIPVENLSLVELRHS